MSDSDAGARAAGTPPPPPRKAPPPPPRTAPPPPPGRGKPPTRKPAKAPADTGSTAAQTAPAAPTEAGVPSVESTGTPTPAAKDHRAKRKAESKPHRARGLRQRSAKRAMRKSAVRAARGETTAPKRPKRPKPPQPPKAARGPRTRPHPVRRFRAAARKDGQLGLLLIASHPLQALAIAIWIGVLAAYSDRGVGQSLIAALAVLLTQLALGLHNDVSDAALDAKAQRPRKPIASGELPAGNATFVALALVILAIPAALENGSIAGAALLATLPVGYVHNRILHRTPASFVGWMVTFALYPVFLAYGGWGGGRHGDDPTWQFIVVCAFVGLCAHFATTLPQLVADNAAGARSLPLRIALRTGAPRLLLLTVLLSVVTLVAFIVLGINPGLRQW